VSEVVGVFSLLAGLQWLSPASLAVQDTEIRGEDCTRVTDLQKIAINAWEKQGCAHSSAQSPLSSPEKKKTERNNK
jgi:hypothetical protein